MHLLTRAPVRALIISLITAAGALFLLIIGPRPELRGSVPLQQNVSFIYMIIAFPAYGVLIADLLQLSAERRSSAVIIELAAQLFILGVVALMRIFGRVPLSGHALVFSYVVLRRVMIDIPTSPLRYPELLVIAGFLSITVCIKLWRNGDPVSLLTGVTLSLVMVTVSWFISRYARRISEQESS